MGSYVKLVENLYCTHPFLTGMAAGIAVCILFVLLLWLVRLFRGAGKVTEFVYDTQNGQVMIRSSAVSDLVFSVGKDFCELTLNQVLLYRKRKDYRIRVVVDYHTGDRLFPEVASAFQQAVLDALRTNFGMEMVDRVEVCMRKLVSGGSKIE